MCFTRTGYRNNRVSRLTNPYTCLYFEHYATVLMVLFKAWVTFDSTPCFLCVARSLQFRRILGGRNLVHVRIVVAAIFDFMTEGDWGE